MTLLLVPAALVLVSPMSADASWRDPWRGPRIAAQSDPLVGDYVNRANGGSCSVYRHGRSYVFVNENGSRARFAFTAPRQLEMVSGEWDGSIVVTVVRGRFGRPGLRFDSANSAPGYWTPAN